MVVRSSLAMAQVPTHHPRTALSLDEVLKALESRKPWTYFNGAIEIRLQGLAFAKVCRLVGEINDLANQLDHHPDVSYGYQHLTVRFQTHDAGGITRLDLACADHILTLLA
jgi:4a-hydroxytetrahydrobiopterin dehydratase